LKQQVETQTKKEDLTMSNTLSVKLTKRKHNGDDIWEGTVAVQGVRPTKLTKSKSQETAFSTSSAVKKAAEKFATTHGYAGVKFDEPAATSTKVSKTGKTTTAKKNASSPKKSACSAPITSSTPAVSV
jgi:hypothetical protein